MTPSKCGKQQKLNSRGGGFIVFGPMSKRKWGGEAHSSLKPIVSARWAPTRYKWGEISPLIGVKYLHL